MDLRSGSAAGRASAAGDRLGQGSARIFDLVKRQQRSDQRRPETVRRSEQCCGSERVQWWQRGMRCSRLQRRRRRHNRLDGQDSLVPEQESWQRLSTGRAARSVTFLYCLRVSVFWAVLIVYFLFFFLHRCMSHPPPSLSLPIPVHRYPLISLLVLSLLDKTIYFSVLLFPPPRFRNTGG